MADDEQPIVLPVSPEPGEDVKRALRESGVLDSQEAWDEYLRSLPDPDDDELDDDEAPPR
jgi:hypothetical protein